MKHFKQTKNTFPCIYRVCKKVLKKNLYNNENGCLNRLNFEIMCRFINIFLSHILFHSTQTIMSHVNLSFRHSKSCFYFRVFFSPFFSLSKLVFILVNLFFTFNFCIFFVCLFAVISHRSKINRKYFE